MSSRGLYRQGSASSNPGGGGGGGGGSGGGNNMPGNDFMARRAARQHLQRGSSGGSYHRQNSDRGSYHRREPPRETSQGKVTTVRENFGFIRAVDRTEDVFFHFSELDPEYQNPDVGDEVEFQLVPSRQNSNRGGMDGDQQQQKKAPKAVHVVSLPPGTIKWELPFDGEDVTPVRRRGKILRLPARIRSNRDEQGDKGILLPLMDDGEEEKNKNGGGDSRLTSETEIYFSFSDLDSEDRNTKKTKLGKGDVMEFALVLNRRTQDLVAKDVKLIQSEAERLAEEREKVLLSSATEERGVVVSMKNDQGFIRCESFTQLVHFRKSQFMSVSTETVSSGDGEAEDAGVEEGDAVGLLVVNEEDVDGGGGGRGSSRGPRLSGRKVTRLSSDSSVDVCNFVARGVIGTVTSWPKPTGGGDLERLPLRDFDARGGYGTPGKIILHDPLSSEGGEVVTEVEFYPEDCPGGIRFLPQGGNRRYQQASQQQPQVGVWIDVGDTLRFDVVRECEWFSSRENRGEGDDASKPSCRFRAHPPKSSSGPSYISLEELNLAGRAEGVVSVLKPEGGYGFMRLAGRPVDVYFRISEVLPGSIVSPAAANIGKDESETAGLRLEVGAATSFDLAVVLPPQQENKESVKATRICILGAPGAKVTTSHKILAKGVRARVTKKHANGSGMVELLQLSDQEGGSPTDQVAAGDTSRHGSVEDDGGQEGRTNGKDKEKPSVVLFGMTGEERYPLISRLLTQFQDSLDREGERGDTEQRRELIFPRPLPKHETNLISNMAEARGFSVELVDGYRPTPGYGKLKIFKRTSDEPPAASASAQDVVREESGDSMAEAEEGKMTEEQVGVANGSTKQAKAAKKRPKKPKPISTTVRFDKSSIVAPQAGSGLEAKRFDVDEVVPYEGDVVICDIQQSRSSGQVEAVNVKLVERSARGPSNDRSGVGYVTELVQARQFGFISTVVIDANKKEAKFKEKLFFHFNKVSRSAPSSGSAEGLSIQTAASFGSTDSKDEASPLGSSEGKNGNGVIKKGDEVRFDIEKSTKNAKRVAVNVVVLSPGTLPAMPASVSFGMDRNERPHNDKQACQGYVLMEPSHTSLGDTQTHHKNRGFKQRSTSPPPPPGGRWGKVDLDKENDHKPQKESTSKEDGCILLLSDPTGMFSKGTDRQKGESKIADVLEKKESGEDGGVPTETEDPAASESASEAAGSSEVEAVNSISAVGSHVHYKNVNQNQRIGSGSTQTPRRGDLVSFVKSKGVTGAKELRIVKRAAATRVRGHLEGIDLKEEVAFFVPSEEAKKTVNADKLQFALSEVVSCSLKLLKEKVAVEGVLHEGKVYGVSRTSDLYLDTKVGGGKERPRLNLTVRKELKGMGGQIMAQSGMAKGPDGTNGFVAGWTTRVSNYSADGAAEADASAEQPAA